MQILWSLKWKNIQIPKLTFEVWDLKTSFKQFGHKAFGRGLTKPLAKNPGSNFHKKDLIFSGIMRWIQQNYKISKNFLTSWSGV